MINMTDESRDPYAGLITSAPAAQATKPLGWEEMKAAWERLSAEPYVQDRWVIGSATWAKLLEKSTPEERRELESLRDNGTLIVTPLPLAERAAYRISGVAL